MRLTHVRPRKFTAWVAQHRHDFRLLTHMPNQFPLEAGKADAASTSFSDFSFTRYLLWMPLSKKH
jgi:hypothetical protein